MTPGNDRNICSGPDEILKQEGKNAVRQQYFNPAIAAIHLNASQCILGLREMQQQCTEGLCAAFWKGQFVSCYSKA